MKAILACTPTGGIGYNNRLPWSKLKGDLPRFKQLTENQTIIMGRKTYDSVGALPNRTNLVFSKGTILPIKDYGYDSWVIGGAQIFELFYSYIDELHLSITYSDYNCDTYIDLLKIRQEFKRQHIEFLEDHTYEIWTR